MVRLKELWVAGSVGRENGLQLFETCCSIVDLQIMIRWVGHTRRDYRSDQTGRGGCCAGRILRPDGSGKRVGRDNASTRRAILTATGRTGKMMQFTHWPQSQQSSLLQIKGLSVQSSCAADTMLIAAAISGTASDRDTKPVMPRAIGMSRMVMITVRRNTKMDLLRIASACGNVQDAALMEIKLVVRSQSRWSEPCVDQGREDQGLRNGKPTDCIFDIGHSDFGRASQKAKAGTKSHCTTGLSPVPRPGSLGMMSR